MTVRAFLGIVARSVNCATCHRNGTVTYYDPLKQQWIEGARTVPIHALTVLPRDEEERVRRHLGRNMAGAA
jgi:hypothetical protein